MCVYIYKYKICVVSYVFAYQLIPFIQLNSVGFLDEQILILADESLEDSVVHSDSRSLATLLLIRDIQVPRYKVL